MNFEWLPSIWGAILLSLNRHQFVTNNYLLDSLPVCLLPLNNVLTNDSDLNTKFSNEGQSFKSNLKAENFPNSRLLKNRIFLNLNHLMQAMLGL